MSDLRNFEPGGYAFLAAGFPYSAGVIALPGFRIVRARLPRGRSMQDGFAAIRAHLESRGRPLTALCAAELRSPAPFSFDGFREFNRGYVDVLREWTIVREGVNPVARSNVCPVFDPPSAPGFFAFSYTIPADDTGVDAARASHATPASAAGRDFVVAGSGEWPEGTPFPEGIVARGDVSAGGLDAKAAYVLRTMRERCERLGGDWSRLSAAQVYTAHDIHRLLETRLAPAGLTALGLTWHPCRPPITELEFEMDVRSVAAELTLAA